MKFELHYIEENYAGPDDSLGIHIAAGMGYGFMFPFLFIHAVVSQSINLVIHGGRLPEEIDWRGYGANLVGASTSLATIPLTFPLGGILVIPGIVGGAGIFFIRRKRRRRHERIMARIDAEAAAAKPEVSTLEISAKSG